MGLWELMTHHASLVGKGLINNWAPSASNNVSGTMQCVSGKEVDIAIEGVIT